MNKIRSFMKHPRLALAFAGIIFCIDCVSAFLAFCGISVLSRLGLIADGGLQCIRLPLFWIICLILGIILAGIVSVIPDGPINQIIDATDKIADGDYSVRIDFKWPKDLRHLSQKFNDMVQELGSVEMLRSDFVNNFSHELKTPIASIQGFAQILLDRDVPPQEQEEYLTIIVRESKRLTGLATNILNLSKIEQQTILTDKKSINISEQIRTAIIALDLKWAEKKIDFQFDNPGSDEIYAVGNEELLQQVWMNLLDNAVKFSEDGGSVSVSATQSEKTIDIAISNQGERLSPEILHHAFEQFYQGDTSHKTEGNGLGLTITKKIVELHKGRIFIDCSEENWITFHVSLPTQ